MVLFEYDEAKSRINADKHGIDFVQAQSLWDDPDLVVFPSRMMDEVRMLAVGRIRGRYWTAVFTVRNERIRLISVRRSRSKERGFYENQDDKGQPHFPF